MLLKIFSFSILISILFFKNDVQAFSIKAYTEDWAYHNYLDKDGNVTGASTEILREISKLSKVTIEFDLVPWARAYKSALKEKNSCVYTTTFTPEREPLFKWVMPISYTRDYMYRKKENSHITAKSLDDVKMKQYLVGVTKEDVNEQILLNLEGFNLDSSPTRDSIRKKLHSGRIDLWFASEDEVVYEKDAKNSTEVTPLFLAMESPMGLACNKSIPDEIIVKLQEALSLLVKNGTMSKITKSYQQKYILGLEKNEAP